MDDRIGSSDYVSDQTMISPEERVLQNRDLLYEIARRTDSFASQSNLRNLNRTTYENASSDTYIDLLVKTRLDVINNVNDTLIRWLIETIDSGASIAHNDMSNEVFITIKTVNLRTGKIYRYEIIPRKYSMVNLYEKHLTKDELIYELTKIITKFSIMLTFGNTDNKLYRWWFSLSYNLEESPKCNHYTNFTRLLIHINKIRKQLIKEELTKVYREIQN